MRYGFLVVTVTKKLRSLYICGSYRRIKTEFPFFETPCIRKHVISTFYPLFCTITKLIKMSFLTKKLPKWRKLAVATKILIF